MNLRQPLGGAFDPATATLAVFDALVKERFVAVLRRLIGDGLQEGKESRAVDGERSSPPTSG
ncbi:hypothetical protein [Streptomyces sp. NPDC046182]|uniref:hypothetical protein n=1 Tax=Streptomyces sp. NPDC046182 TaxID=3154601 RepID=UPI003401002F